MWAAVLGKFLTIDNLCRRHILRVYCCCMCKNNWKGGGGELVYSSPDPPLSHGFRYMVLLLLFVWAKPAWGSNLWLSCWVVGRDSFSSTELRVWQALPLCIVEFVVCKKLASLWWSWASSFSNQRAYFADLCDRMCTLGCFHSMSFVFFEKG